MARTIRGTIQNVDVVGTYTVNGPLTIGTDLILDGDLSVADQNRSHWPRSRPAVGGTVTMTNPAGVMTIGRNANFRGGSTAGRLTAGRMDVAGNLAQDNSGTPPSATASARPAATPLA